MAIMIGNLNNPIEVSNTINCLYSKDMHSIINEVLIKFFDNIKQLYLHNFNEFVKQFSIVLGSIVNLNDQKLCINIIHHINDNNLKYKIIEFFSYKWLESLLDKQEEWTFEQIKFMNFFFQQLKIKDVIKIIKIFNFHYKEEFICNIFKDTFEINPVAFFMESIKQSYIKLVCEIIKIFPEIVNNSEEMLIDFLQYEGSVFNKSILLFCNTINNFLQTKWAHILNKLCNSKNLMISMEIINWIINNVSVLLKNIVLREILVHSIINDNQFIFSNILKYFQNLSKLRILNIIIDTISNNNSIILNNYLLQNIFYNDEIDNLFYYAKKHNLINILKIFYTHYSYKIYCINDQYYMMDLDVVYKSINTIMFKNMKYEYISEPHDCSICYNTHSRIIKLDCHNTHLFCEDCLSRWIISHSSCPLCRNNIDINNASLLFVSN